MPYPRSDGRLRLAAPAVGVEEDPLLLRGLPEDDLGPGEPTAQGAGVTGGGGNDRNSERSAAGGLRQRLRPAQTAIAT